jgi:phage protein D
MKALNIDNATPRYTVKVAGSSMTQEDSKGLEYLHVEDHVDMIGVCELTFAGGAGTAWSSLEIGSDVSVVLGEDDRVVFSGCIVGARHQVRMGRHSLTVEAMDPLVKLGSSRVTKVFEKKTDSDVAKAVLSAGHVTAGTIDKTTTKHDYILQRNESNLGFLRRLAARNGMLLMAREGKVDFCVPAMGGTPMEVPKAELVSLDYAYSTRAVPASVTCRGWDYTTKKPIEGTAKSADIQTVGAGTNVVKKTGQIWKGDAEIADIWVTDQNAAKEMARAELDRLARNFLRGRAILHGSGQLRAGVGVKFTGHRTGFNPEGFVISARHRVRVGGGFTTEVVFCSNTYPT